MFQKAVVFAYKAHEGQVRKGSHIPYISHLLEVASIVSLLTEDEDVRVAALLHDVVEDTDTSLEEIELIFGNRVATLVYAESEDKTKSWLDRKKQTVRKLKNEALEVKWIALADKLSNMRASARDYFLMGDAFLDKFHEKDKALQGAYYMGIADALKGFSGNGFYEEYVGLCHLVFGMDNEEKGKI